jgi:Na+/melibiose symporter-like transporter
MKQRHEEASKSLHYFRVDSFTEEEISDEFKEIEDSVAVQPSLRTRYTELFTRRDLFQRLWRAALLQFMAQMCGATAIKYYLPTLFKKLGLGYRLSLLVSGIESTLKIGCTIIEMLIIDKFGRRNTLLFGCIVMAIAMLVCSPAASSMRQQEEADKSRSMAHCPWHTRTT